jgi:hypothetical protein
MEGNMAFKLWHGVVACLVGGVAAGVAMADPPCPGSPSYSYSGATSLGQSGTNADGYGLTSGNIAFLLIDKMNAGDDCERYSSNTHYAMEEFTWWMIANPGCTYTVTYYFTSTLVGSAYTDVDDVFDCDYASSRGWVTFWNDGAGSVTSTASAESINASDTDSFNLSAMSPTNIQTCVGNGTLFSATLEAYASGEVRSEAIATASAHYSDPSFVHSETLCTAQ